MTPVIFINCKRQPFVDHIMTKRKTYETRTRNTLKSLMQWSIGERILIAETGSGSPLVKCSAVVDHVIAVYTHEAWSRYADATCIPVDSEYDWTPETKVKYLYHLSDVQCVTPFRLPSSSRRHGRVWAEYEGDEYK